MNAGNTFTVTKKVSFAGAHQARRNKVPDQPTDAVVGKPGRVPHVSRLMALAIHYQRLMRDGAVNTQAEIATSGGRPASWD